MIKTSTQNTNINIPRNTIGVNLMPYSLVQKDYEKNLLITKRQLLPGVKHLKLTTNRVLVSNPSLIYGLYLKLFMKKYYNNDIPYISNKSIYRYIQKGYYGGITEVYKPYGEDLFYYDVNSLYPFVALQDMPGTSGYKFHYYNYKPNLNELFGFFYCHVHTPTTGYIGLLPVRIKVVLHHPLGNYEGWYFSEELKFAAENGYAIDVIKGYSFNRQPDVFKRYVHDIYLFFYYGILDS